MQPALHHIFREGPPFECNYPMSAPESEIEQFLGGERLRPQDSSFQNFTYTIKGGLEESASAYAATQGFSANDPVMMDFTEGYKVIELFNNTSPLPETGPGDLALTLQYAFFTEQYQDTVLVVSVLLYDDGTSRTRAVGPGAQVLGEIGELSRTIGIIFNGNGGEVEVLLDGQSLPLSDNSFTPQPLQLVLTLRERPSIPEEEAGKTVITRVHSSREQWFQTYPAAATGICEPVPQQDAVDGESLLPLITQGQSTPYVELEVSGYYELEYSDGESLAYVTLSENSQAYVELEDTRSYNLSYTDGSSLSFIGVASTSTPYVELEAEVV